jgi:MFS transporter, putative metabolite:H+ symporter
MREMRAVAVAATDTLPARVSAASRLDRLPISSFHKRMVWLLGFVFFFELGDIYSFAFAAPALINAWKISISTISFVTSATFIGMFVGATWGGWFSDRVGRKRALLLSTVFYSGFSLLNAFVWEPTGLFVTRLLTGVGLSAMTVVGITYISEMFPARKRGAYQGWVLTIGLIGVPVTAYVARFSIPIADWGWRVVFVWGALGLLFPLFASQIEESPRWYENHGDLSEADAVLDRIEASVRREHGELPPPIDVPALPPHRGRFRDLGAPAVRSRTAVLLIAWIAQTLGFHGFTSWVPTLLVAHGFSLVKSLAWSSAMSIGTIPGALIAAVISDRFERKWLVPLAALVVAGCGLTYGLTTHPIAIVTLGFLMEMFLRTFSSLLYAYTPECFPTEVRNTGAGLAYGVGRLANIVGPLVIAFLFNKYGYGSVFMYIAAAWVIVAITIGGFGPHTKRRILQ